MSSKDKFSIYRVGIIIMVIVLLTWLNGVFKFIPGTLQLTWIAHLILPSIISILAIALFIKLIVIMHKARKKAIKPQERYFSLYEQAQVGLITTSLDGSKIIMANPKMLEMLGFDNFSEIQNLSAYTLWANPTDRLFFLKQLQNCRKLSAYRFPAICKDGSIKELELYAILDSESGRIESNIIDVTEKQTYEKHLLYQATLLENIQESIVVIDKEGIIQFYNQQAEKLFKISEHQLIDDVVSILNNAYDPIKITELRKLITAHHSWQGELCLNVNGESRIFMNRIGPIYNGQVNEYVIMSTDITELVQNREQAEAANLAKSQFLANMSHEIRTPMIGILGAVDLLEQNNVDTKQLENINIIRECGEDLLKIINDILDVSKIEIGLVSLNLEKCNIYDLFYRTINMIEPALSEKGLKLEVDLYAISSIEVYLDPYKLRQILTNILFNAIKYTSQGTIILKAHIDNTITPSQLIISISDTGIGISSHYMPFIFDPFSQEDSSTSRGFGGTGLGLYICKKLIDVMGGTINVNSELGNGTEFVITIPLEFAIHQDKTHTIIKKANTSEDTIHFIPRSVLVVEDNELNQKIVCEMLRNYGFEVSTAKNGLECLQILQHKNFDAILLDMQMPIMDGYETARLIREDIELKHIPIIAMTAHAMNGDREKCLVCGCTSYIAKPFRSEDLINEIKQHLTSYSTIKDHSQLNNLFINELIPEFLNILSDMIDDLDVAINKHNFEEVKSISHDIKGTSGMYGFNKISKIAAQIEKAAHDNSIAKIDSLRKHLNHLYREATEQVS